MGVDFWAVSPLTDMVSVKSMPPHELLFKVGACIYTPKSDENVTVHTFQEVSSGKVGEVERYLTAYPQHLPQLLGYLTRGGQIEQTHCSLYSQSV